MVRLGGGEVDLGDMHAVVTFHAESVLYVARLGFLALVNRPAQLLLVFDVLAHNRLHVAEDLVLCRQCNGRGTAVCGDGHHTYDTAVRCPY